MCGEAFGVCVFFYNQIQASLYEIKKLFTCAFVFFIC
jgi:hypothetical protein